MIHLKPYVITIDMLKGLIQLVLTKWRSGKRRESGACPTEFFLMEALLRGRDKEREFRFGLMAKSIQVDGKTIKRRAKVRWFLPVGMSTKDSTLTIFTMDMEG